MAMMNQNSASPETTVNKKLRTLAIVFAAVCVLALLLPVVSISYIQIYDMYISYTNMLIDAFFDMLASRITAFGFLPVLAPGSLGIGASLALYVSTLGMISALVLAIVAIFRNNHAVCLLKTALFIFTWAAALQVMATFLVTSYLVSTKATLDTNGTLLALAGAIAYFYILLKENKRSAWLIAGQFVLCLLAAGFLFLALTLDGNLVQKMIASPRAKFLIIIATMAIFASVFLTTIFSLKHNKWTAVFQLINAIALLGLSICLVLVSYLTRAYIESYLIFTILAAIVAFLQILLCILNFLVLEKKAEAAAEDLFLNGYELEEYVEVIAYDPAKAQYAERVDNKETAKVEAAPAEEEIADDPEKEALFEGKEDAFIATLSKAEKYEFADLYILKTKGNMGAIPTYEVGAENKAFFKKIFIYLSQYREKISSELLSKIYDYSEQA